MRTATSRRQSAERTSGRAYLRTPLGDLPGFRWAKVARARRKIQARMYELEGAVDAILPPLAEDISALMRA